MDDKERLERVLEIEKNMEKEKLELIVHARHFKHLGDPTHYTLIKDFWAEYAAEFDEPFMQYNELRRRGAEYGDV